VAAPASGAGLPCGLLPLRATSASLAGCCPCERRHPPLRAGPGRPLAGGLGHDLVVGGRPYMGAGRG
ncbi:hypothetical protein B296_00037031, partial [Ensete ventricosum]